MRRGGSGLYIVVLVLLFLSLSLSALAVQRISDVRPEITVAFSEGVILIPPFFVKNVLTPSDSVMLDLVFEQANRTFVFVPTQSLKNGQYIFELYAMDLVGNREKYVYEFEVDVPGTRIIMTEPNSIGVANSTTFRVSVLTTRIAACRYTGVPVTGFSDPRLKNFDITGDVDADFSDPTDPALTSALVSDHTILEYTVQESFPKDLYVVCKDDLGRDNFAIFKLYADTRPPTIRSAVFSPSPVAEYPPSGELTSTLSVEASEPVLCRYSEDGNSSFSDMIAFPAYDVDDYYAYDNEASRTMTFPPETIKQTFNYYVQCMDRAGLLSPKRHVPVTVDLTQGLQIRVDSPERMSGETMVRLDLTTNIRATCAYKSSVAGTGDPTDYDDPESRISTSLATTHTKFLGFKPEGRYPIVVRCEAPEGVGTEAGETEIEYTYIIDTSAPAAPIIDVVTPTCEQRLEASFSANDSVSGISGYRYVVQQNDFTIANGSTDSGSVIVDSYTNGSSFDLDGDSGYYFDVSAVDGAGNVGPSARSEMIVFDATGTTCDTIPPTVTVTRSADASSVEIDCFDEQSGCSMAGSYYGSAYEQPCNTTLAFLFPVVVPLFRSTIFCWSVFDNAGNENRGEQLISLTAEDLNLTGGAGCPGGIDHDGDGYGERCLFGADCDDTDPEMNTGCANGCIQDLDGDGYGVGCDNGPDCNGLDSALNEECPNNCISDNDGDGYGLGCDSGPDCKGDDSTLAVNCPNGCLDDNDGDGYGLGCPTGFDCNGENRRMMSMCENGCIQDTDGDGFGIGCSAGLDCDGGNPAFTEVCENGCIFDEDSDDRGFGCVLGNDCNGINPFRFEGCANGCISDNDGDTYGWMCGNGDDCNDTDPFTGDDCALTTECIIDHDGDGYGIGCALGPDCDDFNPVTTLGCTENCTFDTDCNGLPDDWQAEFFNNTYCNDTAVCGPDADPDGDGLTNLEEFLQGTDPLEKDELRLPPAERTEETDADNDGMPDACETLYSLDPGKASDADMDYDNDGLDNKFECNYKRGKCVNWLNPTNPDHDGDGYLDGEEIEVGTDPCDPDDHPSKAWIGLLIMILGILCILGSTGYLVYKNYYVPLVTPPKPKAVQRQPVVRPRGVPVPGVRARAPRRMPPRPRGPSLSREAFRSEMEKRAQEREKVLSAFGARKETPRRVMETLAAGHRPGAARRAAEARRVKEVPRAETTKKGVPAGKDYVSQLTKVVGPDYVDIVSSLSKKEADYMGRLATIAKEKEVSLEDDHVSKLTRITRHVTKDRQKRMELTRAFKESDMGELDSFLSSRKHVDTFIREAGASALGGAAGVAAGEGASKPAQKAEPGETFPKSKSAPDEFDRLAQLGADKSGEFEALADIAAPKRKDVLSSLEDMSSAKDQKTAMSKMEHLSSIESKAELVRAVKALSRDRNVDKNVFEVLLSYLLKSGKVTKSDVSEMLFELEEQGMLSKKDVSDVLFNIGVKK